jgi:hypothetical protein
LREVKVWVTKRYEDDGTITVLARKPLIAQALYQHQKATGAVDDPERIITTNPKGVIYGYGYDIKHFKNNKACRFRLQYGFVTGEDNV